MKDDIEFSSIFFLATTWINSVLTCWDLTRLKKKYINKKSVWLARTVFRERSSRKTVRFEEQIMSKDKYRSRFSWQIMAIVFIVLQIFATCMKKTFTFFFLLRGCPLLRFFINMTLWTNKYFTPAVTTIKRFLNLKRRLISWRGRYVWKLGISPGWYFWISPSLSWGC